MGLIERILEKVITDHAGQFLKINADQLKTSLLKGEVVLTNVEIKTEALGEMMKMLPFRIKFASVKLLKAKVPWNELNSKSVRVHVSGVEIVLEPQQIDETSAGDSWADVVKRQRLLAAEMLLGGLMETDAEDRALRGESSQRGSVDDLDDDDQASQSTTNTASRTTSSSSSQQKKSKMTLIQRIVARILDNLGITVDGLVVRYESQDAGSSSFALELESLNVFTVASALGDTPVFVDRTIRGADLMLRRRIKLMGLAFVWQRAQSRREMIAPFGIGVNLIQHLSPQPTYQFSLEARTEGKVDLTIGPEQIADLTSLVERITAHDDYVTRSAILKLRPNFSVGVDPAAWWRYAIKAHTIGMRQALRGEHVASTQANTWPKIMSLIQQRIKYIALYKQKLILEDSKFQSRAKKLAKQKSFATGSGAVTDRSSLLKLEPDNVDEIRLANELLRELEIVLPFRTIMLFRSFADAEFQSEKSRLKKLHKSKQIPARAISAMVHGASSMAQGANNTVQSAAIKRKNFIKALSSGFRKPTPSLSSSSPRSSGAAPTTPIPVPSSSLISGEEELVDDGNNENELWMLSVAEKQVLYETVAVDPATAWLLDQTSFGTTKTRMGLTPASLEAIIVVPRTCIHLLSGTTFQSFFDVDIGLIECKFENFGQHDIVQSRTNLPMWACEVSLASMEFVECDVEEERIPGSFTTTYKKLLGTTGTSNPLLQLQLHSTYLGQGQSTRMRIGAELQATQLVMSFPLIQRFAALVQPVAAPAMTSRVQALRQYGARRAAAAAQQTKMPKFDVKIDWTLPSVLLPISQHHTLELSLGKFRARSSAAVDARIDAEVSGIRLQLRRLQIKGGHWGMLEEDESKLTNALMSNTNFEAKIQLEPQVTVDVVCVSGISLRLPSIEPHWNAIGKTLAMALDVRERMPVTTTPVVSSSSSVAGWKPTVQGSLKIPKVEVYVAMIPGPGWIKIKTEQVDIGFSTSNNDAANMLRLRMSRILIKDDVQQAGEHFKDLLRIDGTVEVEVVDGLTKVSVTSNMICNWNPTTMTRLVAFVAKNLMQRKERKLASGGYRLPPVKKPLGTTAFPKLLVSFPHTLLFKLNQEALGVRFGIIRLENIQLKLTATGRLSLGVGNLSLYGMQWRALNETRGTQLFGSDLCEELARPDEIVSLEMDLVANSIDVQVRRIRFLWAHTLTKQFADYLGDGVAQVFAPLAATVSPSAIGAKPNLQIKGTIHTAFAVCPALRFGKEYVYSEDATDEIVLVIDKAPLHIVVHDVNSTTPLLPVPSCNAGSCGRDATKSHIASNNHPNPGQFHRIAVEILIQVTGGELFSHHKRPGALSSNMGRRKLASGFTGKLLWRIVDFSPEQTLTRKGFQPNTAKERARMDYCRKTFQGGLVPPAEMPKGVSPQKFEMYVDVDADNTVFDFALQDVHLIALVVFENIADHRRRIARVRPPQMPLFAEDIDSEFTTERGYGPDELANGNFGPTSVVLFETKEDDLPIITVSDQQDFSGEENYMVDLELFLNIPLVNLALSVEAGSPAVVHIAAKGFQMSLTEFYNRSQGVELGLEGVEITQAGKTLLSCQSGAFLRNPNTLRQVGKLQPKSPQELLPRWEYVRTSRPVSIVVTKFPGKDKRVEIGLEKLQFSVEFDAFGNVVQSLDGLPRALAELKQDLFRLNMPGGTVDGPKKLPRALALELYCNQLVIKRDAAEEVALQGSARVLVSLSRGGEMRGLVESRLGLVLKCLAPEIEVQEFREDEEFALAAGSPQPYDYDNQDDDDRKHQQQPYGDLRSWLESVYRKKNPTKLADVDSILRAFHSNEAELIRSVSIKYDEVFTGVDTSLNHSSVIDTSSPSKKRKPRVPERTSSPKAVKKMDVGLVEPFMLRIDLGSSKLRTDLQCIVDPIVMRVTNGNLDLIKAALVQDGTLMAFAEVCSAMSQQQRNKKKLLMEDNGEKEEESVPQLSPSMHFTGLLRGVECILLNDFGNSQSLPLVKATMIGLTFKLVQDEDGLVANLGVVSTGLEANSGLDVPMLRLDHFNPRLLAWEPLMEPWEFAFTVHANRAIEFSSKTPLNVNFSYSFAESFANWVAWRSASVQPVRSRNHVADHYVVNESGLTLQFGGVKSSSSSSLLRTLETGRRAALGFVSANVEQNRHGDYYRDTRAKNALAIGEKSAMGTGEPKKSTSGGGGPMLVNFHFLKDDGTVFATLQRIPIDSFGTMVYGLGSAKVMVHVSLENGSKVVRVRSPLHVQNSLNRSVDLLLASASGGVWALGPLPPSDGTLFPIPVDRLNCKLSFRPVTPPDSFEGHVPLLDLLPRVELEAEASDAMTRQCDENGYAWGPSIKLLELHALVDRPLAMLFDRSKSYSVATPSLSPRRRNHQEDDDYEEDEDREISFVQQRTTGGYGTQFSCLVGVKSIPSSQDGNGLRENYIVQILPAIRVENRLPCDLFCRSMHYSEGDQIDVPLGGGRVTSGEDLDIYHVKLGGKCSAQILHDADVVSDELWLTMSLPNGFDWSAPFRPTDETSEQHVLVPTSSGSGNLRLLLESEFDEKSGSWQIVVFVESWLVNDARFLVPGLQLRETGGVSGEEYLHDFKDRAHSMYEKLAKPRPPVMAASSPTSPQVKSSLPTEEDEQAISLFTEGRNVVVRFMSDQEQLASCSWSNVLMLDAVGSHADVKCDMLEVTTSGGGGGPSTSNKRYVGLLGVSVNVAPNVAFRRSRVVTFAPRLLFVNSTGLGSVLYLSSGLHPSFDGLGTKRVEHVDSLFLFDPKAIPESSSMGGEQAWAHSKRICPILRLCVEQSNGTRFGWSGPFQCIDSGGEFTLKLVCHSQQEHVMVVRIRFEERDACTVVFVEEESLSFPIYRILNQSDEVVEFCQDKMQGGGVERLESRGANKAFGWMEPNVLNRRVKVAFPNALALNKDVSVCINLDELSAPQAIHLPAFGKSVWASVRIRGMTKTLLVTDQAPNDNSKSSPTVVPTSLRGIITGEQEIVTLFRIELSQVGLSLIDRAPQELLYLSLTDTVVEFSRTRSNGTIATGMEVKDEEEEIEHLPHLVEALEFTVQRIQIDNQLNDAQFQVLLGIAKQSHSSAAAAAAAALIPMVQIKLVRRRFPEREEWFDYVELARFELAELDCKVEDSFLLLAGRMAWDCAMSLRSEEELVSGLGSDGAYSRLTNWLATNDPDAGTRKFTVKNWLQVRGQRAAALLQDSSSLEKQGKKIYFAVLHILPLCVNLSFRFTATDPIEILTFANFKTASSLRGDDGLNERFDAEQVSKSLPPALINIDSARIRLLALYATHVLGDRQALFKTIAKHYTRQAITQVYYILGSSDLIGNPLGIVVGVAKGVNELVFHPMQGITNASPVEFVQGVGKGSVSFVRHVLSGTLDSFSKLSGALGAGVALLSLDQRFVANRWDHLREQRDQSMTGVLTTGASAFAYSLLDGAGGVVYRPFLANTPIDFVRELGKGLVGLAVKPVVGLLDLASRTTHGVSSSLLHFDSWLAQPTSRVRLPRAFRGFERRLDPYSAEDALVTLLIKQLEYTDGVSMEYLAHAFIDAQLLLVSAGQRLWCLHCVNRKVAKVWHLPLDAIDDVQFTIEPDFPAVRICFANPSSFVRLISQQQSPHQQQHQPTGNLFPMRKGGAFDVELIIGGQVGLETQAILAFHVDSFTKARTIAYRLRKSLRRRRTLPVTVGTTTEGEAPQQQQRRTLGLVVGPIPRQMRYLAGSGHVGGIAVVLKVVPGSAAEEAGLQEGDILLTCDGQTLDHGNPKETLLRASQTGQDIVLRVKRKQNLPSIQCVIKV
ncbi:hypothetical protein BASA81_011119 [Batrachochytrium salamandrivorans]|nr:hypothetical protein BASA81_011119 [Batrachochytrium salamandrivorans]